MARKDVRAEFTPHFEGKEILDGLLDLAGCSLDSQGVLAVFQEAAAERRAKSDVIPTLFVEEPHFPDPSLAKRLYENLFGLWELAAAQGTIALDQPRPPAKPKAAEPPGTFQGEPDTTWVERAWRYVEELDERSRQRLEDAFENRQDALLMYLDEVALSDNAFAQARELLFELWAMLQEGLGKPLRSVRREELSAAPTAPVPDALRSFAEEALFEAQQDEKEPLSVEESREVEAVVLRALSALWSARGS